MADVAQACQEAGLKLIVYYSQPDWHHPDYGTENHPRYIEYLHGQIHELLTNYGRLDGFWFDLGGKPEHWETEKLFRMMRSLQPWLIINNRIGLPGDFDTPEQRLGSFQLERPWETCMTLGTQWSWKPDDEIKSLKRCIDVLVTCAGRNGNLALNTNPMPDGQIEPRQAARFREIGQWMQQYGESIYGTRGGPFKPARHLVSTRKDNTIYLHILAWPEEVLALPALPARIVRGSVLTGGAARIKQTDAGIEISVPRSDRREIDTVVALELDRPAMDIAPIAVASVGQSLAEGAKVTASNVYQQSDHYAAAMAVDGDGGTRWATDAGTGPCWLEVDLGKPETFDRALIAECVDWGVRVKAFELECKDGDEWKVFYTGKSIGKQLEVKFEPVTARFVRLNITEGQGGPTIFEFQLFAPAAQDTVGVSLRETNPHLAERDLHCAFRSPPVRSACRSFWGDRLVDGRALPCRPRCEAAGGCRAGSAAAAGRIVPTDTVSQHGITWKFEEKVRVGRFVGGDYYVVGPVKIIAVTPPPGERPQRFGAELPPANARSGFDDRVAGGRYDAKLAAGLPVSMKPGDALVSSISVTKMRELPGSRVFRRSPSQSRPQRGGADLPGRTPPPDDAFRPSYWQDRQQRNLLGEEPAPGLAPSAASGAEGPPGEAEASCQSRSGGVGGPFSAAMDRHLRFQFRRSGGVHAALRPRSGACGRHCQPGADVRFFARGEGAIAGELRPVWDRPGGDRPSRHPAGRPTAGTAAAASGRFCSPASRQRRRGASSRSRPNTEPDMKTCRPCTAKSWNGAKCSTQGTSPPREARRARGGGPTSTCTCRSGRADRRELPLLHQQRVGGPGIGRSDYARRKGLESRCVFRLCRSLMEEDEKGGDQDHQQAYRGRITRPVTRQGQAWDPFREPDAGERSTAVTWASDKPGKGREASASQADARAVERTVTTIIEMLRPRLYSSGRKCALV